MKLISNKKYIIESSNIREMYEYTLKNGIHFYPMEYVDIVLRKIDTLNINEMYKDMCNIYDDIEVKDFNLNKCACCGKEEGLAKTKLNNTYEISLCDDCITLHKSPKSIYIGDFLENLSSLYELIQFTNNNQILLSTSRHIKTNEITYKVKTKLGDISFDAESDIFYVHKNV